MTTLSKLVQSKTYSIPINIRDTNNLPIVLSSPVQFYFRDTDQDLILQGSCLQDNVDTSLWVASITIPSNLPSTPSTCKQYSLTYIALLQDGSSKEITKIFDVIENRVEPLNDELPVIAVPEGKIKDNLLIPSPFTVESYSITIRDDGGNVIYSSPEYLNPVAYISNDHYNIYNYQSADTLATMLNGQGPGSTLQIIWTYFIEGVEYTKINPIYILSAQAFALINALKMTLNKGRVVDLDPNLSWRDFELLHFVVQGLLRVNSFSPPTAFDINSVPSALLFPIQKAALLEALSAWYLAEGIRSFDYQGNPISLTVDRTQYIQTLMDQTSNYLDSTLASTKQSVAVNSGRGALGITSVSLSLTSNWPSFYGRLYGHGLGYGYFGTGL